MKVILKSHLRDAVDFKIYDIMDSDGKGNLILSDEHGSLAFFPCSSCVEWNPNKKPIERNELYRLVQKLAGKTIDDDLTKEIELLKRFFAQHHIETESF